MCLPFAGLGWILLIPPIRWFLRAPRELLASEGLLINSALMIPVGLTALLASVSIANNVWPVVAGYWAGLGPGIAISSLWPRVAQPID